MEEWLSTKNSYILIASGGAIRFSPIRITRYPIYKKKIEIKLTFCWLAGRYFHTKTFFLSPSHSISLSLCFLIILNGDSSQQYKKKIQKTITWEIQKKSFPQHNFSSFCSISSLSVMQFLYWNNYIILNSIIGKSKNNN